MRNAQALSVNRSEHMSMPQPNWILKDKDAKPIGTFIPKVLGKVEVISTNGITKFVKLELRFKSGETKEVTVPLSELDSTNWFEVDQRCLLNPDYRKAKEYIGNIIRSNIILAPIETKYCLERLGMNHIKNENMFFAGDRVITRSSKKNILEDIELPTNDFRLDIDPQIHLDEAFEGIFELINLSQDVGRILVAHVISGIIRAAFVKARFIPRTVLVIVGESGMLKSHYIPHLAQLYNRSDEIRAVTRCNSTQRFIEDVLQRYTDCTAVIDDLHTAESNAIRRINETTVEEIIRRVGDDTGRGHKEGNALVQKNFGGNVVLIGEYSIGKASTIPRTLVVNLNKAPNGSILDKYQRHKPLVVSTFYYFFIQWYIDHYDEICGVIDKRLTEFRESTAVSSRHGRLRDTQFYLQVSFMMLLEFCKDSKLISEEDSQDTYHSFCKMLEKIVQNQQDLFKSNVDNLQGVKPLKLIRKLWEKGKFCIAANKDEFDSSKHDGVLHYDCLCLRGNSMDREFCKIIPNYNHKVLIKVLRDRNVLKLQSDKNTVQIQGLGGMRFYAIRLEKLKINL